MPPEQKAVGSNPAGDASISNSFAVAGLFRFRHVFSICKCETALR